MNRLSMLKQSLPSPLPLGTNENEIMPQNNKPQQQGYVAAKYMLTCLLTDIYTDYIKFTGRQVHVKLLEHPRNPPINHNIELQYKDANPLFQTNRPYDIEVEHNFDKVKKPGKRSNELNKSSGELNKSRRGGRGFRLVCGTTSFYGYKPPSRVCTYIQRSLQYVCVRTL